MSDILGLIGENGIAKSDGESIAEHTENLIALLDELFRLYGDRFSVPYEVFKELCVYHDVGKESTPFQYKILKAMGKSELPPILGIYDQIGIEEVPHGYLSAMAMPYRAYKNEYGEEFAKIMLTVVAHHHYRNLVKKDGSCLLGEELEAIAKAEAEHFNHECVKNLQIGLHNSFRILFFGKTEAIFSTYQEQNYFLLKGILNKLDYCASSPRAKVEYEPENATENVRRYFQNKHFSENECQKFMSAHADENIIVAASTGIGKTESSLLWAGKSKTFYTLPLKVAINEIYKRITDSNGYYAADKACFLHSDTLSMLMDRESNEAVARNKYDYIRNLSYPFTVCTADQLFSFVFKADGTEVLPATLSYSKIIIDEIQAYEPRILAYILFGLKVAVEMGCKFCIMTATLPPIVKDYFSKNKISFSEPPAPFYKMSAKTGEPILRHNISIADGDMDYGLIAQFSKEKKVLVVVNTVKKAQEVYTALKEEYGVATIHLLHSRFKQTDRNKYEKEIMQFSRNAELRGVWVATQIVEASLDIDFDVLFTEMCGADNLLQRMGRCYRSRDYTSSEPNCFINVDEEGRGTVYEEEIYDFSVEDLRLHGNGVFTEPEKTEYVNKVFAIERLKNTKYRRQFDDCISYLKNLSVGNLKKEETRNKFRNISAVSLLTQEDYQICTDNGLLEKVRNKEDFVKSLTELRKYCISVNTSMIRRKKNPFSATEIGIEGFYLTDNKYSKELGLISEIDEGSAFI